MDISIACSDRSLTPELKSGQTAATRRILAQPSRAPRSTVLVERLDAGTARHPLVRGVSRHAAQPMTPLILENLMTHPISLDK